MSINHYNPHDRYRKRAADRFGGFLVAVFIVLCIFGIGYWVGQERSGHSVGALKARIKSAETRVSEVEAELIEARSQAGTATMRFEQLEQSYQEQIPEGPVEDLLALLRKQIEEGRDPERLAFLIRSARPPRNCSEIETRRFVVSTPANQGPDSQISVADGAIVIQASGVSARNDQGRPEAWFDPTKNIALTFITLGGQKDVKKGVFPLHHSVVVADREYRFTVSDGARSFAKVTFDSCDYP